MMDKEDSAKIKTHLKAMHAEVGGDHFHLHGGEDGFTSHAMVGGKMTGPKEHATMREAKAQMGSCMDSDGDGM